MYRNLSDAIWDYLTMLGFSGTSIVIIIFFGVVLTFFIVGGHNNLRKWKNLPLHERLETGRLFFGILFMLVMIILILIAERYGVNN